MKNICEDICSIFGHCCLVLMETRKSHTKFDTLDYLEDNTHTNYVSVNM